MVRRSFVQGGGAYVETTMPEGVGVIRTVFDTGLIQLFYCSSMDIFLHYQ